MIILLSIVIYPTIHKEIQKEKQKGITAMQGKNKADIIAIDWNSNASLAYVSRGSEMVEGGLFESWYYSYFIEYSYPTIEKGLAVRVYANGIIETSSIENAQGDQPLTNWTLDSDMAYNLIEANSEIKNWLFKYDDAKIDGFYLRMYPKNNNIPSWTIDFYSPGFMDNPHNARIIINAQTGDILEVEL